MVIILDNSSYHKRLDIQKQITKEIAQYHLEFLQARSRSKYYRISLAFMQAIAHRLFQSVAETGAIRTAF